MRGFYESRLERLGERIRTARQVGEVAAVAILEAQVRDLFETWRKQLATLRGEAGKAGVMPGPAEGGWDWGADADVTKTIRRDAAGRFARETRGDWEGPTKDETVRSVNDARDARAAAIARAELRAAQEAAAIRAKNEEAKLAFDSSSRDAVDKFQVMRLNEGRWRRSATRSSRRRGSSSGSSRRRARAGPRRRRPGTSAGRGGSSR